MATRRMISKSISTSHKLTALYEAWKGKRDRTFPLMLFTWLQPHLDDWGRCDGTAFWIKYNVVPTLNIAETDIEQALLSMEQCGLIVRYNSEHKTTLQVVNFEEHQIGLNKRTESKFAEAPEEVLRNSKKFQEIPSEGKGREQKGIEQKRTEKKEYAPSVVLSEEQHKKLTEKHGEAVTLRAIEFLSNYKQASGKTYKSDYHALLNWAIEKAEKEQPKENPWGENDSG